MKEAIWPMNNSTIHTATRRVSRKAKDSRSWKGVDRLVRLLPFACAFKSSDLKAQLLLGYHLTTFVCNVLKGVISPSVCSRGFPKPDGIVLQKVMFSGVRANFLSLSSILSFLQKMTPEIRFSKPYSRYSLFFKHIWNSERFLLNVERDEFGLRVQFWFFLNVFSCLLTTNLSRRNNRSRAGPQTLFNFRRNSNRRWIPITFHVYSRLLLVHSSCCHQKCSLDRDRMQITRFSFYDHDSTQSECAHRLVTWKSPRWRRRSSKLLKRLLDWRINASKANIQVT